MRKVLIIFVLLFMGIQNISFSAEYSPIFEHSTKPVAEYYTKLYNEYMDKVKKDEIECSRETFTKYVDVPTIKYIEKYQDQFSM